MTTTYRKVTAQEATTLTGVQVYQASEWYDVESVTLAGPTAAVRFTNGGTDVAPSHFFIFRVEL